MSNAHDRRASGTTRIPFDAMVEVGGALGPSFEAQAVNLSEEGMSLRTAYLPEVGQPVMCRFDAGEGMNVVASGEVLWKDDMGDGGEFGIRFMNLDGASTVALQRILGMAEDGQPDAGGAVPMTMSDGRKVRLHIEGLAAPMRARIRGQQPGGVTAYSELGFLQMGKPLDLEDAQSGGRRPALIDHVEVAIDNASKIPQLVVSLRYDDAQGQAEMAAAPSVGDDQDDSDEQIDEMIPPPPPEAMVSASASEKTDDESVVKPENKIVGALRSGAAKISPAILGFAKRAKTTAALLAVKARRKKEEEEEEAPVVRRTTAPAPGGGLHAEGRKVVRGQSSIPDDVRFEDEPSPAKSKLQMTKKKIFVASSIGIAGVLVFLALRKPATPQIAAATADSSATPALTAPPSTAPAAAPKPVAPPADPLTAAATAMAAKPGNGKATPFTNGPVGSHPTVIKIKMDGPIDTIQGAAQPTGFTVVIPNRKSVEPTASLADKDGRIATVGVSNEATGAEFSVSFKDGVPNYIIRSHGDTLEMVLAKGGAHDKAAANAKEPSSSKAKKHKKH